MMHCTCTVLSPSIFLAALLTTMRIFKTTCLVHWKGKSRFWEKNTAGGRIPARHSPISHILSTFSNFSPLSEEGERRRTK